MSKKKSRRKMKPYQVKLRVIGVLSLVVAMLVMWLPFPSKAVDGEAQTHWQDDFTYSPVVVGDPASSTERYIDLIQYAKDGNTVNADTVIPSSPGVLVIPPEARDGHLKAYKPRIGVNGGGTGLFKDKTNLTDIDLQNVITTGATNLANLFSGCTSLTKVTFGSSFDTSQVTDFSNMFKECAFTTLDLSGFEMSAAANADGMLDGCDNLATISSPKNLPAGVTVQLPWKYRYTDVTNATAVSDTLPTVGTAAGNIAADTSVTLTRVTAVDDLTIDPTPGVVEIGNTISLTITLLPTFAADKGVTITSSNKDIATLGGSGVTTNTDKDSATATVGTDGTVSVEVTGVSASTYDPGSKLHYDDVTIKVISDGNDINVSQKEAAATIRVWEKLVKVTGASVSPKNASMKLNETITLTATVSPSGATEKDVTWTAKNVDSSVTDPIVNLTDNGDGTVTVSAAGTILGDVYIEATTVDGGFHDHATVTVTSPYDFIDVVDNRESSEVSNTVLTTGTVSGKPVSADAYLHINTDSDATRLAEINGKLTGYDPKSCFRLSKHNAPTTGSGTAISDDLGTATITMALPGKFLTPANASKQVKLFAYDGTDVHDISSSMVKTTITTSTGGSIGAVRFAVNTADSTLTTTTYVLAIKPDTTTTPTGFLFTIADDSTKATPRATSGLPEKQTSDLYLVVDDSLGQALKPLVDPDPTLSAYTTKHYYDIYLTDKSTLEKPNAAIDFGSIEITLPLPDGVNWQQGSIRLVSEHNGAIDRNEAPRIVQNTTTGDVAVQFTATHFSEYAILYDPSATTPSTGYTVTVGSLPTAGGTVTGGGTVTPGDSVTVVATPAENYVFAYWTDDKGAIRSGESSYTFTPTGSEKLFARFDGPGSVAGAERTADVTVNVSIPPVNVTATVPDVNVNVPAISVSIPDINVIMSTGTGTPTAAAGASATFVPVRISNGGDMPTTGIADVYRMLAALILGISGLVEVMLSVPARKRVPVRR